MNKLPYMPQKPTPDNAPKTPNYRNKARKALREAGKLEGLNPQQRKRRITRKAERMEAKDMTVAGDNPMNKVMFSKGGMAKKGYAKGGYAMCGASNPPAKKR
jgi:hypothetical protein